MLSTFRFLISNHLGVRTGRGTREASSICLQKKFNLGPLRIYALYGDMSALPSSTRTHIMIELLPALIAEYANINSIYQLTQIWNLPQTTLFQSTIKHPYRRIIGATRRVLRYERKLLFSLTTAVEGKKHNCWLYGELTAAVNCGFTCFFLCGVLNWAQNCFVA